MTPTQITTGALLVGLLALAALLFLLQRLRVRHEERVVITTMFWKEALEESRARTLFERFRHPLTYLLLLAAAGLLWLSYARLDSDRSEGTRHVLLLDGSAAMGTVDSQGRTRFDDAKEVLAAELASSPRDRTEVLFVGQSTWSLLRPGEHKALLEARLAGLEPQAVPSGLDAVIRARASESGAPTRYVAIGDALVTETTRALLGPDDVIERIDTGTGDVASDGNLGVTALGMAPAASGAWGLVDVQFDVRGAGAESTQPTMELDGAAIGQAGAVRRTVVTAGHTRYLLRDVEARGGQLTVRALAGTDALAADDAAEITLPNLPPIRVAVGGGEALGAAGAKALATLRSVLQLDSAIEIVTDATSADVLVGVGDPSRPSLVLTKAKDAAEAIFVGHDADADSNSALARAVGELALDRIDATSLADDLGTAITVGAAPAEARRIELWSELFSLERTRFVESRACPVVLGRAVRWLAATETVTPYLAAGLPVPSRLAGRSAGQQRITLAPDGVLFAAAPPPAATANADRLKASAGPWRPFTWILIVALALLLVEWVLFQRGRIA